MTGSAKGVELALFVARNHEWNIGHSPWRLTTQLLFELCRSRELAVAEEPAAELIKSSAMLGGGELSAAGIEADGPRERRQPRFKESVAG